MAGLLILCCTAEADSIRDTINARRAKTNQTSARRIASSAPPPYTAGRRAKPKRTSPSHATSSSAPPPPYTAGRHARSSSSIATTDFDKAALQKDLSTTDRSASLDTDTPVHPPSPPAAQPPTENPFSSTTKPSLTRRSVARPSRPGFISRLLSSSKDKDKEDKAAKGVKAHTTGDETRLRWEYENALKGVTDPAERRRMEEGEERRRREWVARSQR